MSPFNDDTFMFAFDLSVAGVTLNNDILFFVIGSDREVITGTWDGAFYWGGEII